jgi:hypothetical protein
MAFCLSSKSSLNIRLILDPVAHQSETTYGLKLKGQRQGLGIGGLDNGNEEGAFEGQELLRGGSGDQNEPNRRLGGAVRIAEVEERHLRGL